MSNFISEQVLNVHHWSDNLFSFQTTRSPGMRFRNGEFVMLGMQVEGKPLMRAYSIASPNHEDHFEFFSIKVQDGALTSRLQHLNPGDEVLISKKPTGTLVIDDLRPGKRLYLLATGTGLAAFLPLIQDPEVYERFEHVVLFHGVRHRADLAYYDFINETLPNHEFLGEMISEQLKYFPALTREPFTHRGRLTKLVADNQFPQDLGLPALNPDEDRVMVCGGPQMLADIRTLLDQRGFAVSPRRGEQGDYVIERAFAER